MSDYDTRYRHPFYIMGEIFKEMVQAHHGDFFYDGMEYAIKEEKMGLKNRHKIEFLWIVGQMGTHMVILGDSNWSDFVANYGDKVFHIKPYAEKGISHYQGGKEYMEHCFIREITRDEAKELLEKWRK